MFKRRTKSKNSFLFLNKGNRGSDITKPNNTSLIVNDSDEDADELPKELTSIFSEDEEINPPTRKSSSVLKSFSQKTQSTPKQPLTQREVLKEVGNSPKTGKRNSQKVGKKSYEKKKSFFHEMVRGCGATPLEGDSSYSMSVDQAVFSIQLNNKLKDDGNKIKEFIKSLEEEMEESEVFQKLLAHTLTAEECSSARGPVQDPLMRMLLMVDCLQNEILKLLLKKLADIVVEGKMDDSQIISSVLRQIRFLNRTGDVKIASELFEIIQVASVNVQREIIFFLPEVITEEETEETCDQLIDLLKFDAKLTHVVVDALTNLPLNKETQCQVRAKVLNRLDKSNIEFLPSLVQFVLSKCEGEELPEVINGLRENLPFTLQHHQMRKAGKGEKSTDEDSYIKLTFENLKFAVMSSKNMAESWTKIISNINSSVDFRCVDLVILVIFYGSLFGRRSQTLALIRNKIKSSVLNSNHVQNMFKILKSFTVEYFSTILELASILLKSIENKISEFGALLYKECFINFNLYMGQTVISEILLHIGTGSPVVINTALSILKDLSETQKESLCSHTVSIMGLLIKVADLDLSQVRTLMDVISGLVFCDFANNSHGWEDELQIFIRKQLVSSKLEQCKKGIVAAIMLAKHGGQKEEDEDFKYSQINALLEMAMGSNGVSETKRGFFNDEFASMVRGSNLKENFLKIWNEKIHKTIMDNLFVKDIDIENSDFPMFLQYSLETRDEDKLVFPVVVFVINSATNKTLNIPVPVIPSALRLLWCLESDFTQILPVVYSSVIMPEGGVYENFRNFDDGQKKKIMDCLFLCANFLIECTNALCIHGKTDKALLRVKQLIGIRKLISTHINSVFDFTPNSCQFYAPVQKIVLKKKTAGKKPKKGRKRKINETEGESSMAESLPPEPSTSYSLEVVGLEEQVQSVEEGDLHLFSGYFRELHWDTHKLLEAELKLNAKTFYQLTANDGEEYCSYKQVERPVLHTSDVLFLLEDIIFKSEQALKETKRILNAKAKQTVTLMEHTTAEQFVTASVKIFPNLFKKIDIFSDYCKDLLKANDYVYDSKGMYPQGGSEIKLALAACLKFVAEILSWKGFQNPSNKSLLRDVLSSFCGKSRSGREVLSLSNVGISAIEACKYLAGLTENVLVLSGAISIVKAIQFCLNFTSSSNSMVLAELCNEILSRNWYTVNGATEKGPLYNQHVDFLLKTYFSTVDNKLEVVRTTAKIALAEVESLNAKDSTMNTFKTINKSNFPLLYRTICEALISASTEEFSRSKNDDERFLTLWNVIVEILLCLVDIAKIHSSRLNLASLLKRSQSIIQLFLSKGMPVVESALRVKSVQVLSLLKAFQTVTRFLHSICCHSKITNDSIVAAHVPSIRSLCERLTLEVKGVLIMNKIPMECITIAILKNRDLKGNDIISQESLDDFSDDDSELPPEDTPDNEDELKYAVVKETQESNSESY